jgi:hypothetical protein
MVFVASFLTLPPSLYPELGMADVHFLTYLNHQNYTPSAAAKQGYSGPDIAF